jgi:hypothetical protein
MGTGRAARYRFLPIIVKKPPSRLPLAMIPS